MLYRNSRSEMWRHYVIYVSLRITFMIMRGTDIISCVCRRSHATLNIAIWVYLFDMRYVILSLPWRPPADDGSGKTVTPFHHIACSYFPVKFWVKQIIFVNFHQRSLHILRASFSFTIVSFLNTIDDKYQEMKVFRALMPASMTFYTDVTSVFETLAYCSQ